MHFLHRKEVIQPQVPDVYKRQSFLRGADIVKRKKTPSRSRRQREGLLDLWEDCCAIRKDVYKRQHQDCARAHPFHEGAPRHFPLFFRKKSGVALGSFILVKWGRGVKPEDDVD